MQINYELKGHKNENNNHYSFLSKKSQSQCKRTSSDFQRITVNGKRNDKSTGNFINSDKWHSEISKVKVNSEEARTINSHLDYLKNQVLETENKLFKKDIKITSENLKNELYDDTETTRILIPIFQ